MSDSDGQEKTEAEIADDEAMDWLIHLSSGAATKADMKAMEQWRDQSPLNQAAIARASRLWKDVRKSVADVARRDFPDEIGFRVRATQPRLQRRALMGGAVAATAAYCVVRPPFGLWPSFQALTSDYRTGPGEQRRIALAGASVELNTETSLNAWSTSDGARLKLVAGEAVISTVPNAAKPLVVMAANGQATAAAATFNIRYFGDSVCVTCVTGSVDVAVAQDGNTVTIQERQQVTYMGETIGDVMTVDPAQVTAWQQGMLIFHGTPLSQVIAEVNRYLPGRIVLMNADLGRQLVTARFRVDRLQEVLTEMQVAFGAHLTKLPGGVVLVSS